jgi:predicted nucleic acid-binding protein
VKAAVDTNVLAYAEGLNGAGMKRSALTLLTQLPPSAVILPVQVLGELFQVLVRRAGRSPVKARAAVLSWRDSYDLIDTSAAVMIAAADLAAAHQFSIWDAVILSAAAEAECRLLLSEDMQDGYVWRGVTVANPFAPRVNPLLSVLLSSGT